MNDIARKKKSKFWLNKVKHLSIVQRGNKENQVHEKNVLIVSDLLYFNRLTQENTVVEYTVLLTLFNILMHRFFEGKRDVISKSSCFKSKPLFFSFIDVKDKTIREVLEEVKEEVQEAYKNLDYEETIVHEDLFNQYTDFNINYGLTNTSKPVVGFQLDVKKNPKSELEFSLIYDSLSYPKFLIDQFLKTFKNWLINIEKNLDINVLKIPLLNIESQKRILAFSKSINNIEIQDNQTIHGLFETKALECPTAIAIEYFDKQVTYQELNERANRFANYLETVCKIQLGDLVGVKVERNELLPIILIGILKCGAAYVPIDINYPSARVAYIEKDSNSKLIVDKHCWNDFIDVELNFSSKNSLVVVPSFELGYIIYTSGTTGKPKGVMITHSNAISLIYWAQQEFDTSMFDIVYAVTSHCFDLSVFEIFYTLSIGKPMRILNNGLEIPLYLDLDKDILLNTVPSTIRKVLEEGHSLQNVSILNLAGEPFPVDIANRLVGENIEIRNLYGPSEDTTYSTCYKLTKNSYRTIPIGKPISNTQAYVLDDYLELLPSGVTGRLYLSGNGIAKGYLNRFNLTSEKFIENPFLKGTKMYDTGDLARWGTNDNIEYLGRRDDQIKLRGYRIELGEIENAILQFSKDIQQVVVVVKKVQKEEALVAYYIESSIVNKSYLRTYLGEYLPSYMIPNHFVKLESIPLTPNGKVNKEALPDVDLLDVLRDTYVAPGNKTEKKLVSIWEEVIGIKGIGIKDNFFELGGHSLMISQMFNIVYKVMNKSISFKAFYSNPTIESISKLLQKDEFVAIKKIPISDSYTITPSQHRLWLLSQIENNNQAYQITGALLLEGNIIVENFKKSFKYVVDRHEILRTYFKNNEDGILQQYIVPISEFDFNVSVKDFSKSARPNQSVKEYIKEEQNKGYDLSKGPLFTMSLLKINDTKYVFFLSMHHIISDGWSLEILTSEIIESYRQLEQGECSLPYLSIQFKDYASWLEETNTENSLQQAKAYWLNSFEGELPVLEIPSFKNRPLIKTYTGKELNHSYSEEVLSRLKVFSQQYQVTLFMTLMSAIKTLLFKYSNQRDIIVGTPIAGREHPDLEPQIGLYINTLAIRTQLNEKDSFLDLLKKEKHHLLEAYSNQSFPFDRLVEELNLNRNTSRSPLFDVMMVLQNQKQLSDFQNRTSLTDVTISEFEIEQEIVQFDLSFAFVEDDKLSLNVSYNTDIYDEVFIKSIFLHLENLFEQILISPDLSIEDMDLLTDSEKKEILIDFNDTKTDYPKDKSIIELFVDQVKNTPDTIALIFEEKELTYRELDEESSRLANYLLSNYKIEIEDLVGIKLDRSELSIISLLAVLKIGGAYVPIDPNYPQSRIRYIEEDSNCKLVIDKDLLEAFKRAKNYSNTLPEIRIKPDNLAYVIYTSGSTGKPKGILVEHRSVVRLVVNTNYIEVVEGDKILGLSSFSFDGSTFDIFMSLLRGATLVVSSKNIFLDINNFEDILIEKHIDSFFITTALFNTLVESELRSIGNLKYILFGGEQVSVKHVRRFKELYPEVNLHHVYGPTENTTYSTYYTIKNVQENIQTIPIGTAISNSTCYILDSNCRPVPVGVIGEIYLGGDGLARGYLNKRDLTEEKFISHPFKKGKRLYKTGDLAKWTPDKVIEFVGRKDDQVKIRGYRIELGEIENVLLSQPGIKQAVVTVKKQAIGPMLVAYIVSESGDVDEQKIRVNLSRNLPDYMLPNCYVTLDAIPLTSNGKIDKEDLPEITGENILRHEYVAPRTTLEKKLVSVWQDVLHQERVGVTDNFFDLGGHSLMISQVINRIHKNIGKSISYALFYNNPTIERLCDELKDQEFLPINCVSKSDFYPTTPAQQRLWFLSQFEGATQAYNISGAVILEGNIVVENFQRAFNHVINRHEILRTYFQNNDDGFLQQFILSKSDFEINLSVEDFSESASSEESLKKYLKEEQKKEYDLSNAPLLKASLLKRKDNSFIFFLSMHHIISDGWSIEILTSEIITGYQQLQLGENIVLPELSLQFKDYAVWLAERNTVGSEKDSKEYWLNVFQGELPILELPSYKKRPQVKTYSGNVLIHSYSEEILSELKYFSNHHEVTLFMTLMSVVKILLSRYSNQKDIILGTPIAGREYPDLESQIGLYLNTLAIRTQLDKNDSFLDVLKKEKQHLIDAYSHQDFPFDVLVEQLNLNHDTSRSPLFDVMVVLQNQQQLSNFQHRTSIQDLTISEFNLDSEFAQFDLSFAFEEKEGLCLSISYNTDIYEESFIRGIFSHLENIFLQILESPSIAIEAIDILTTEEKQILLKEYNHTRVVHNTDETIISLFEEQVILNPENIAIEYGDKELTYSMLNDLANDLAYYLKKELNISAQDFIGVKLERSERLLITLLAILKAGATYVPIDVNYPKERIAYIEKDSNCRLVIDENQFGCFLECQKGYSKENIGNNSEASNLAYIVYTSGTTGYPKGVMISHQNAVALINWAKDEFSDTNFDVVYAATSHCFDLSIFELFYTLSVGKKIKLLDNALKIGEHLREDSKILLNTVPSSIRNILEEGYDLNNVSAINLAGEPFTVDIAQKLLPYNIEVRNLYGPSEDTTYSTCYKLTNTKVYTSIPIGRPITNTQVYILDDNMQLLPSGAIGKLYISGAGVAQGYLNRSELTAQSFIENPYCKGEYIYDTGDLARWLPDKNIEFLGRKDTQVKVRGYRIELGEIENALLFQEDVDQCVVIVKKVQGDSIIVSYLVSNKDIDRKKIHSSLSKKLPNYMLPSYYIELESMPLTLNGKINKSALPEPDNLKSFNVIEYVAPRNVLEEKLVLIWQDILQKKTIGIEDSFFTLGGHSLKATRMISRVQRDFDVKIELKEVYQKPTISNLSNYIQSIQILNAQESNTLIEGDELVF
ncbi:non-ribosomal peptide synthetase [Aquimarina algiphila]|uniref:non-ribosomal peptide synthetase n=1 Tax=Aquimarina algiphila TaxID=2047982 RepID=UPI00248F535C|nr:non-ribosomal peptide synthetase [Aquimarina algiphila]